MSNKIEKVDGNPTFIPVTSVPFRFEDTNRNFNYFDVELNNLKRAYDVFLEPSDSINLSNYSKCEKESGNQIYKGESVDCGDNESSEEDKDVRPHRNRDGGSESQNCSNEEPILQLQECGQVSQLKLGLIESLNTLLKMQQVNFENQFDFKNKLQEGLFSCFRCEKKFTQHNLLMDHLPVHEKKCFNCPTCDKVFPAQRYLVRHLERHKQEVEIKKDVSEQIFKCTTCQKCFTKKESMIKHSRIHARDLLKCSICDFTCNKKVALKMHVVSHEGNRKYKCDRCDFSFKQIGHLKRHIVRFKH